MSNTAYHELITITIQMMAVKALSKILSNLEKVLTEISQTNDIRGHTIKYQIHKFLVI